MFRKLVSALVVLVLVAAAAMLATGPAIAQHGSYHHGGYHHGGYYHHGYYPSYHHYGYHYPSYYYHGYYPSYYSSGYYPNYSGPLYLPGYYSRPSYYPYSTPPTVYQSSYPPVVPGAPVGVDQVAHVTVRVPADAVIWFNGAKTTQTGPVREFVSPPLASGYQYTYELQARWTEAGQTVTQTQQVAVRPGERAFVVFPLRPSERVK